MTNNMEKSFGDILNLVSNTDAGTNRHEEVFLYLVEVPSNITIQFFEL